MDLFSRDILVWVSTHIRLATFTLKVWILYSGDVKMVWICTYTREVLVYVSTHIRVATFIPKVWFCLFGRCRDGLVLITRELLGLIQEAGEM